MIKSIVAKLLTVIYTLTLAPIAFVIVWFGPHPISKLAWLYFRLIMWSVIGVKVKVQGLENVSCDCSYVFLSNHQSALDIPALVISLPFSLRFIAKRELSRIPFFGWAMVVAGHVMVDRKNVHQAKNSLTKAIHRIKKNRLSVIAFPEGTRTRDGKLLPFKKGVFVFAIQAGLPIVPIAITGAYDILPKGARQYKTGTISIQILPPVETTGYTFEIKDALMQKVHHIIAQAVDESTVSY